MNSKWYSPEHIAQVRKDLVLNGHKIGNSSCNDCKYQLATYKVDTYGSFPKVHSCGGYIHIDIERQGDDGWESPYSSFICENCGPLQSDEFEPEEAPPTLGINVTETITAADKFG